MGKNIADLVLSSFEERRTERKRNLRLSTIGKPKRQLWYQLKNYEGDNSLKPNDYIKFLYGHILEELLLFLTYASGHSVTEQQKKVKIGGITGHKDCRIDGTLVDIKSASSYGMKKFKDGSLFTNDPFGYISQISAYAESAGDNEAAFLAIDKSSGEIVLMPIKSIHMINATDRVNHLKKVVTSKNVPDKCNPAEPDGKSGNMKLSIGCVFCGYKDMCWADANGGYGLRKFQYSTGMRYLNHVSKTPDVKEIRDA